MTSPVFELLGLESVGLGLTVCGEPEEFGAGVGLDLAGVGALCPGLVGPGLVWPGFVRFGFV